MMRQFKQGLHGDRSLVASRQVSQQPCPESEEKRHSSRSINRWHTAATPLIGSTQQPLH